MKLIIITSVFFFLTSCGSFMGIPSHGGGTRFAIEQELVAATARSVIKDINLNKLKGKKAALFIVSIGDEGSGNLLGSRSSFSSLIRGQHINTPNAIFPIISTTTDTGTTTTTSEHALSSRTETKGGGHSGELGIEFNTLNSYRNNETLNPKDSRFLSAVIQSYLFLQGINITNQKEANYYIYINVDVFGTIRSRTDWLFINTESLRAKTAIEVMVFDKNNQSIFMSPQVSSYEAEYKEHYHFWIGPVKVEKTLYQSDGLLANFVNTLID